MIAKSQEEINILREGGRRLASHLKRLTAMVKPGMTTREMEDVAFQMVEDDGDEPAFKNYKYARDKNPMPSGLNVSINDAIVHNPAGASGDVIQEGDVVTVDFGIKHAGLFTDSSRTVIAGKPLSEVDVLLVRAAYEALDAGIAQARIGKTTGDIGYAIEQVATKYGYDYPKYLSGHGVGKTVHEEPHVPNYGDPGVGTKLVEGMVIAIEPMFCLGSGELKVDKGRDGHAYRTADGKRTSHAEHTVLITKEGPEILTRD